MFGIRFPEWTRLLPKGDDACCWFWFPGNGNDGCCCCCCDWLLKLNEDFWASFDPNAGAEIEPNDGGCGALLAKLKADFGAFWFGGAEFIPLNDCVGATVAVLLPKLNDGFALGCELPKIDWPEGAGAGGESAALLFPKGNDNFWASEGVVEFVPKTGVTFFEKIELGVEGFALKPPKTDDGEGVTVAIELGEGFELNANVPGADVWFVLFIPVKLLDEYEGGPKALVVTLELLPNDGGVGEGAELIKKQKK